MAFNALQLRELRATRKLAGLCQHCGKPLDGESQALCKFHNEQYVSRQRARRDLRRVKFRCVYCGKRTMGTRRCLKCKIVNYGSPEQRLKRQRERREEYKRDGKCTGCGTPLDREVDGAALSCAICRGGLYAMA
jgi:hypothetical protein